MRGQPVMPSQVSYRLFELAVLAALQAVGLDIARYGQLSWQEKEAEYPRSRDIAEAARFLDYDGLEVPSARHPSLNVVAFCNRLPSGMISTKAAHGLVVW